MFEYAPNGNVYEHLHGTTLCFSFSEKIGFIYVLTTKSCVCFMSCYF